MDGTRHIRTTATPLIRAVASGLGRTNARHPWDHNAHFHRWILRALPERTDRVLDVGCGRGALLRPGGHLLVVALVRPSNAVDHLWDVANVLSNPLIGLVKHPRPARGAAGTEAAAMPVRRACTSPAELRAGPGRAAGGGAPTARGLPRHAALAAPRGGGGLISARRGGRSPRPGGRSPTR